jgi:hypothetical protein
MERDSYQAHLRARQLRSRHMRFVMRRTLRALPRVWRGFASLWHLRPLAFG